MRSEVEKTNTQVSSKNQTPPPNQPLSMYQMANPVTEEEAPGAYTRRRSAGSLNYRSVWRLKLFRLDIWPCARHAFSPCG